METSPTELKHFLADPDFPGTLRRALGEIAVQVEKAAPEKTFGNAKDAFLAIRTALPFPYIFFEF